MYTVYHQQFFDVNQKFEFFAKKCYFWFLILLIPLLLLTLHMVPISKVRSWFCDCAQNLQDICFPLAPKTYRSQARLSCHACRHGVDTCVNTYLLSRNRSAIACGSARLAEPSLHSVKYRGLYFSASKCLLYPLVSKLRNDTNAPQSPDPNSEPKNFDSLFLLSSCSSVNGSSSVSW